MDGVMFVSDDEWAWGWRNEAGRLFQRLQGDAYRKERFVILREEDDGGRAMVMSDDERVRPGGWKCDQEADRVDTVKFTNVGIAWFG